MSIHTTTLNTGVTLVPPSHYSFWPSWFSNIKEISRLALSTLAISSCIPGSRGGVNITSLEQMKTHEKGPVTLNQTGSGQWIVRIGGNMRDFQVSQSDFKSLSKFKTDFRWTKEELDLAEDGMRDETCLATWQSLENRYRRVDEVNNIEYLPEHHVFMATPREVLEYLKTNNTPLYELFGDNSHETLSSGRRDRRSEEKLGMNLMLRAREIKKQIHCSSPVCMYWKTLVNRDYEDFWNYWHNLQYSQQKVDLERLEEVLDRANTSLARSKNHTESRDVVLVIKKYLDLASSRIKSQFDTVLLNMIQKGELLFYLPMHKQPASIVESKVLDKNPPEGIQQVTYGVFVDDSIKQTLILNLNTLATNKLKDLEEIPYERRSLEYLSNQVKWVDIVGDITGVAASLVAFMNIVRAGYLVME